MHFPLGVCARVCSRPHVRRLDEVLVTLKEIYFIMILSVFYLDISSPLVPSASLTLQRVAMRRTKIFERKT